MPTTRLPRTAKICIFQGRSREGAVRSFLQQCSERVDGSNHGAGTQNGCTLAWYRMLTWRVETLVVAIYTPPLRRLRIILEQFVSANAGTRCSCASDVYRLGSRSTGTHNKVARLHSLCAAAAVPRQYRLLGAMPFVSFLHPATHAMRHEKIVFGCLHRRAVVGCIM